MYVHVCVCARIHVCTLLNTLVPNDAHFTLHGAWFNSKMMRHMNWLIMAVLTSPVGVFFPFYFVAFYVRVCI